MLGIFLLALGVRLLYLYDSLDNPTFYRPIVDSSSYHNLALGFAKTHALHPEFFWQQFFYPFFLALVYCLTPGSILVAKCIQIVLGSLACALTFALGRRLFDRNVGIGAGLITAFYGPLIFFEAELLDIAWATVWSLLLLLLFFRARRVVTPGTGLGLGIVGILSVLIRPNFLPFFLLGCLWLAYAIYKESVGWRRGVRFFLPLLMAFVAIATSVALINHRVTGRFAILPATSGLNLYLGNHPEFLAGCVRPGVQWQELISSAAREGAVGYRATDTFFRQKALTNILRSPDVFLQGLGRKSLQLIGSREMPGNVDMYLFRRWSALQRLLTWKIGNFGFPFGVLLPLAVLGILFARGKVFVPLLLFLAVYSLTIIIAHVEARYRAPMIPVLAIFAVSGGREFYRRLRHRQAWPVLVALTAGVAVTLLCVLPGPFEEEQLNYEAEMYCLLASYHQEQGQPDQGVPFCVKALELNPNSPDVYLTMGLLLEEQGRATEAAQRYQCTMELAPDYHESYYRLARILERKETSDDVLALLRTAVRLKPDNPDYHHDLGVCLFRRNRLTEAVEHLRRALTLKPSHALAHYNLANVLAALGQLDEAEFHYGAALRLDPTNQAARTELRDLRSRHSSIPTAGVRPDDPVFHYNQGVRLAAQGRFVEAMYCYRHAIRVDPKFARAQNNLGVLLARMGHLEEAETHFTVALAAKPDFLDARCNYAKLMDRLERTSEAVEQYRKVLQQDPNHPQARKNLDRLLSR